jgi:HD-like signal output (HDOD) protein
MILVAVRRQSVARPGGERLGSMIVGETTETADRFWALRELPPFPAIATKLLRLFASEEVEMREVVELIRADAAFSSELLRVANSPIYGLRSQVSSLHHAIVILGFDTLRSFAMTISMKNFLRPAMRIDVLRRVWRHSLATALICEDLGKLCWKNRDRGSRDRAYTAGLLHDLGRLALLVKYPHEYANLLAVVVENPFDLLESERAMFDVDHCEAGSYLAKAWKFPPEIAEVAAAHHELPVAGEPDMLNLVRSGALIAGWLGFDVSPLLCSHSEEELSLMLPESARAWLGPDNEEKKAAITKKLDSFD